MTSPIHSCVRGVWSLDTPDDTRMGAAEVVEPSADLLDRAQAGWERFTDTDGEVSDA